MVGTRIACRLLFVAGVLAGALALPAAAPAAFPPPVDPGDSDGAPARFDVYADGYRVQVVGERRRVKLAVTGGGGTAIYTVPGRSSRRGITAQFGRLGRIAVEFHGEEEKRISPPGRCRGRDAVLTEGTFTGTIRFRGEGGYVRVKRSSAPGTTIAEPPWRCPGDARRTGGDQPDPAAEDALGVPVLGAFDTESGAVLGVFGQEDEEDVVPVFFVAGTRERSGRVEIARLAYAIGTSHAFAVQPGLGAATVSPPHPFTGTASFLRNADGSTAWSGNLAVPLPGAGIVPLTGAGFRADLRVPRTSDELLDLLGRPDVGLFGGAS